MSRPARNRGAPRLPRRKPSEDVLEHPTVERPLTPAQLREVALELRRHAARYAETETQMTAFMNRSDELRAEAKAIERLRLTKAQRKRRDRWMQGR